MRYAGEPEQQERSYSWHWANPMGDEGTMDATRPKFMPIDVGKINDWFGWPDFRKIAYPKAYEIIHQIAPNKMHALCECQGLPAPEQLEKQKTPRLYCLPWYVGDNDKWNPKDWVAKVYLQETTEKRCGSSVRWSVWK